MSRAEPLPIVLTIGHSTRTLEEFIDLLQAHGVTHVVDVRTVPRSRHNPQFNKDSLPDSLKKSWLAVRSHAGPGRAASCQTRFAQPGLAKCLLSRLCGLHADPGIWGESRRIDPVSKRGPDRIEQQPQMRLGLADRNRRLESLSDAFSNPGPGGDPRERIDRSETSRWRVLDSLILVTSYYPRSAS
jgi:Domain of unknown function DUF488